MLCETIEEETVVVTDEIRKPTMSFGVRPENTTRTVPDVVRRKVTEERIGYVFANVSLYGRVCLL